MSDDRQRRFEVVDDAMAAILRQMTEAERLAVAFRMWDMARDMIRAILRAEHPDWTDEQVVREAARRLSHGAV